MDEFFNILVVIKGELDSDTKLLVKELAKTTETVLLANTEIYETEAADTFAIGIRNMNGTYKKRNGEKWLKFMNNILETRHKGKTFSIKVYSEVEITDSGVAFAAKHLFEDIVSFEMPFNEYFTVMITTNIITVIEKEKIEMPRLIM